MDINPEKLIADIDQSFELILRSFPPLLFSYYEKFKEEGFTEEQAFNLVRDCHLSLCKGIE